MRSPAVPMLKLYGLTWLALFLFAITTMLVSNGLFGVAWFAVADVALSLSIFVAVAVIVGCLIFIVLALITGRFARALVMFLMAAIYALLPFGAILAFALYTYVSPASLAGVSFVLEQFTNFVDGLINAAGYALASTAWQMPDRNTINDALFGLSAGLALLALGANWLDSRRLSAD